LAHQRLNFHTDARAQLHNSPRKKRETTSQFYEKHHTSSKGNLNSFGNERYRKPITFNFTAHNRLFQVTLRQDAQSVFTDDVVFENSLGPINFKTDSVYSGFLEDSPSSSVQGIVTEEGHFDGHISTPTEHFYIEPAKRYFPEGTVDFHSVIYSSKDVLHPSSLSEKSFETKKNGK
jgi:disintegrin and metalloproteinase domain-containing protein 10